MFYTNEASIPFVDFWSDTALIHRRASSARYSNKNILATRWTMKYVCPLPCISFFKVGKRDKNLQAFSFLVKCNLELICCSLNGGVYTYWQTFVMENHPPKGISSKPWALITFSCSSALPTAFHFSPLLPSISLFHTHTCTHMRTMILLPRSYFFPWCS